MASGALLSDMKISEIRNNLFGLSDLKGLINENTFGEHRGGYDWQGYFAANPERLNQSFIQAMGLTSAPKEPITLDQIGDSEIRKHFGDEAAAKILSDPINFVKGKGVGNSYKGQRDKHRVLFRSKQNATALLKNFFEENGGNNISNAPILAYEQGGNGYGNLDREVLEYFYAIKGIAEKAGEYAMQNQITDFTSSEPVGIVENPFSMFLYFFFKMYVSGRGKWGSMYDFEKNVRPEFVPYINRVMSEVKGAESDTIGGYNSIPAIIQSSLLDPIGLRYTSELYEYADVVYQNFFANRAGIGKLEALLNELPNSLMTFQGAVGHDGRMQGTVGSVVYEALIILKTVDNSHKKLIDQIRTFMATDDLARFRSAAYLGRYEMRTNQIVPDDFKNKMAKCFGFSYPNEAFDPIRFIDYTTITRGISEWVKTDDLVSLLRTTLYVTADPNASATEMCPAEKIFLAAKDINTLLTETSFKKYGRGPETMQMTIELLLGDANEGLLAWQKTNSKNIPTAQVKLRAMYNAEKTSNPDEDLSFWRLLSRNSKISDVTQTEIFNWLVNNTDPSVEWKYEYNRKDHSEDDELGGKSIDIMGKTPTNTYCFEYQGEQHYRPINVSYKDYDNFPLYTRMREYILEQCGYVKKSVGGTKFFIGSEDIGPSMSTERMLQVRSVIIDAYRKFYGELLGSDSSLQQDLLTQRISQRLMAEWHVKSVNKKEVKTSEMVKYFQEIMQQSPENSEIFDNPPLEGVIPYIGSPQRFLDEVKAAQDMSRDAVKSQIIRSREKLGWVMSYIIPKKATPDEKKYTEELAGNSNNVFTWDKPGQSKLLGFLGSRNLLRTSRAEMNEKKTLFEEIVKELLLDGDY